MKTSYPLTGTIANVGESKTDQKTGVSSRYVTLDFDGGTIQVPTPLASVPPVGSRATVIVEGRMIQTIIYGRPMFVPVPSTIVKIDAVKG